MRGLVGSSCFLRRRGRREKCHGLLGKSERCRSSLHVPSVCVGWGWVEGDKIGGVEWGPPRSLTPTENILKIFFSIYQYLGLFKYLNKTRIDWSLVGLNLHLPHFTVLISDSVRLGAMPYLSLSPHFYTESFCSSAQASVFYWLHWMRNPWHQAWHTMFAP